MTMRDARLVCFVLLAACGDRAPATAPQNAPVVSMAPAVAASASAGPGHGERIQPGALEAPWLTYAWNGNLLILDKSTAYLFDGTRWYRHTEKAENPVDPDLGGNGIQSITIGAMRGYAKRYDATRMLSTRDLRILYDGPGRRVGGAMAIPAPGAAAAPTAYDDAAIVFDHEGSLVTLTLPREGGKKETSEVVYDASSNVALVTWNEGSAQRAAAYEMPSGKKLGAAVPQNSDFSPTVTTSGHVQYYVAKAPPRARPVTGSGSGSFSGSDMPMPRALGAIDPEPQPGFTEGSPRRLLVVRDIVSGVVQKQREIPCTGFLGNPTVSPDGSTVLVTCGAQAIVLDGKTLAERRRIGNVIPGCDNGLDLSGSILPGTPPTLLLEGCGGIAKVNLASGSWICGDNDGVMGGPYEAMDPGGGRKFKRPAAPQCSKAEDSSRQLLDREGRFEWLYEENAVLADGKRIQLETDAGTPVISPKGDRIVYLVGTKLVARALPSGEIVGL